VALPHRRAGGSELVVVALHALALDKMGDVQHHSAVIHQPATDFFIQRDEEPVHLEAYSARPRLAFACARGILAQTGEIFASNAVGEQMVIDFAARAIVHKNLQVHLSLAAQLFDVGEKLALVRAD